MRSSKHVNNTMFLHTYKQNNTGSSDKHRLFVSLVLASSARGPGFNPQSRTASYQRRNKNGTSSSLVLHSTLKGKCWLFLKNQDRKKNVMDKIWDRKSFEVGGVFTVIADFICSGILFQIGALSDCRVRLE